MSANVTVHGRLGGDAELHYLDNGTARLAFRLASNSFRDQDKTATWYACTLWGTRAEKLNEHLTRGTELVVSGELTFRTYEHKGESRYSLDVDVRMLDFCGSRGGNEQQGQQYPSRGQTTARSRPKVVDSGEIPF